MFNGKEWKSVKVCDLNSDLTFHFKSGYCLCAQDPMGQEFNGSECVDQNLDYNGNSDILKHFYHQQMTLAKLDNAKDEVRQSYANLLVLKGSYPDNNEDFFSWFRDDSDRSEYPHIYFTNDSQLKDENFIDLDMSLDENDKTATSRFKIYIAK